MNKKRIVALFAAAVMTMSLFAGCGQKKPETKEEAKTENVAETTAEAPKVKIGLSTDEGGVNDKSFNQAADEGIKKAQSEFGVEYKVVESKTKDDYEPNLGALVQEKCNLVFAVGYQMHDAVTNAAKQYPDSKFAIIDEKVEAPNVESVVFKEHEGSFLMGVIAGKMTKTNKIGFIGGKNSELIERFEAGFTAGVKAVNPEAAKLLIAKDEKTIGAKVKYADSFVDAARGTELAKQLYSEGCDVIFHAAGGVGIGLFKATDELNKSGKKVWAIGVDKDQAAELPEYKNIILSSMIKKVDAATYNACKDVTNNNFKGGTALELGLKEDAVGVAPTSSNNTPKEVLDLVKKYEDAIKNDTIKVPSTRKGVIDFTAPEIK